MPANVPPELEEKFRSCKEKVMADGATEEAAYGICYTSVVDGKSLHEAYKSFFLDAPQPEPEADAAKSSDVLIAYGGAVKSLADGALAGKAVRFGGQDLVGDTFTPETNYGFAGSDTKRVDILFHHAQPIKTSSGKSIQITDPIGQATLKMTDDGILVEDAILFNAEQYNKYLSKLGWSTGAPSHSIVREGKAIKQWQIAEVSLTPIPAEPRNMVSAKSLADEVIQDDEPEAQPEPEPIDYKAIGRQVGEQIAEKLMQQRQPAG